MTQLLHEGDPLQMVAGPIIQAGRPAYLYYPAYPRSGGYPFVQVEHSGCQFDLVGHGVFSPTDATIPELAALYDMWAGYYDVHHPWTRELGIDIAELICAHFRRGITMLDACCGTGQVTLSSIAHIEELGLSVTSVSIVDISEEMLRRAATRLLKYRPSVYKGDYLEYKPEQKFDVIILGLPPRLRQTDKTLLAVRCNFIVPDPGTVLGWACR